MVIQPNMKVQDITITWPETKKVFEQYGLNVMETRQIQNLVPESVIHLLTRDLNAVVGSSELTCVEGG